MYRKPLMMHEFHDHLSRGFASRALLDAVVLGLGSVPLPVIAARIDRFITEDGKGPLPGYGVSRSRVFGEQTDES
jgi:hypothetical protein